MGNEQDTWDLGFDIELDDAFDPLADEEPDEEEGAPLEEGQSEPEYVPSVASNLTGETGGENGAARESAPARERIATLMEEMGVERATLLGVLEHCRTPRAAAEVNAFIDGLRMATFSVYSPANITDLLERAGALERTDAEGAPYDACAARPKTVRVDGADYLEPTCAPAVYWLTTADGAAALDENDPHGRIVALFEAEPEYLGIYKHVLAACSRPEGASVQELGTYVNAHPRAREPRRAAPYFLDKLEQCGAVAWHGTWATTEPGALALEQLEGVDENA